MKLTMQEGIEKLTPLLNEKKLIIFAGAGISRLAPSNLPSWDDLLIKFVDLCEEINQLLPPQALQSQFSDLIKAARNSETKNPAKTSLVLKNKLKEIQAQKSLNFNVINEFQTRLSGIFTNAQPNENHRLIVQTNYPYILTSNYDTLLENAARKYNYTDLFLRSFTFNDAADIAIAIYENQSCIIHIHGNTSNIALDDFVLTSEDYIRITKKYPGFRMATQTLFLKYSVLFIGYGARDPHVEDFLEELSFYFGSGSTPKHFLVLKEDEIDAVIEKHKNDTINTDIIAISDHNQATDLLAEIQKILPR